MEEAAADGAQIRGARAEERRVVLAISGAFAPYQIISFYSKGTLAISIKTARLGVLGFWGCGVLGDF